MNQKRAKALRQVARKLTQGLVPERQLLSRRLPSWSAYDGYDYQWYNNPQTFRGVYRLLKKEHKQLCKTKK